MRNKNGIPDINIPILMLFQNDHPMPSFCEFVIALVYVLHMNNSGFQPDCFSFLIWVYRSIY